MKDKVETYIGFAIKKGSVVFGVDNIVNCLTSRRRNRHGQIFLVLATTSLSASSRDRLDRLIEASAPSDETDTKRLLKNALHICTVEDYPILQLKNCKALAITDCELAKAIWNNLYVPREEK